MAGYSHDSWYPPAAAAPVPPDGRAIEAAARIARLPQPVREMLDRLLEEIERGLLGAPPAGTA